MSEYTAKGGTRFEGRFTDANGNERVHILRKNGLTVLHNVLLSDLIEFVRSVEGQETALGGSLPVGKRPPLSRRTELLAQMAATMMALDDDPGSLDKSVTWAAERAVKLLAAIESQGETK